jgi:TonB family protein
MKRYRALFFFLLLSGYCLGQTTDIKTVVVRKPKLIDTNAVVLPPLWEPDTPAQFPGGQEGLAKYLHTHIRYPKRAMDDSIQGPVILQLTILADGKVSKIKVVKSLGGGCDEAAMEMVRTMPAWIGAHHKGKHVDSDVYLPVMFLIQ